MENISEILSSCEQNGLTFPYQVDPDTYKEEPGRFMSPSFPLATTPVSFASKGEDIFILSDLHIAAGKNGLGVYTGAENFFADAGFGRFLAYAGGCAGGKKALLVINGDTFDFLRVTDFPGRWKKDSVLKKLKCRVYGELPGLPVKPSRERVKSEFVSWQHELAKIGIHKSSQELEECISAREKIYGLETDDYKTIYKLMKIREGHPSFFTALGAWLLQGHRILMLKGNHDLELVLPAVRHYTRLLIAEAIRDTGEERRVAADEDAGIGGGVGVDVAGAGNGAAGGRAGGGHENASLLAILLNTVLPNLSFIDDSVLIDESLYLEHGHRYDKFAMVLGEPVLKNRPGQINIPFGSFFNRYVINRVELEYPYLDKVRPTANIVPILVRENFPLAIKIFGSQLPFAIRMLLSNRRYIWFMFRRIVPLLLAAVPIVLYGWLVLWPMVKPGLNTTLANVPGIFKTVVPGLGSIGAFLLSYFMARIIGWLQLTEPSSLEKFANRLFLQTGSRYPIMSMGHTHNPGAYSNVPFGLFYNTGTWIPVIEIATAEVREDRTYTYLHLTRDGEDRIIPGSDHLQRWNNDAGRPECQMLISPK